MLAMTESFVDLTYRGLALGKHVKLAQMRPSTGFVEIPAPMPVGTTIGIATEDGVMLEAIVTAIHEQVTGSDKTAGMTVRPKLEVEAHKTWWKQRVELPDVMKSEATPEVGIVRSKRKSEGAVPELMDDGRNTAVMEAAKDDAGASGERRDTQVIPTLTDDKPDTQVVDLPPVRDSDPNIVDDGKRTIAMAAVDLEALGLNPASSSGQMPVVAVDGEEDSGVVGNGDDKPSDSKPGTSGRKKRKRR